MDLIKWILTTVPKLLDWNNVLVLSSCAANIIIGIAFSKPVDQSRSWNSHSAPAVRRISLVFCSNEIIRSSPSKAFRSIELFGSGFSAFPAGFELMPRRVVHNNPREWQGPAPSAFGDGALPKSSPSLVVLVRQLACIQFLRGGAHITAVARRAPRRRVAIKLLSWAARHQWTTNGTHPHRQQILCPQTPPTSSRKHPNVQCRWKNQTHSEPQIHRIWSLVTSHNSSARMRLQAPKVCRNIDQVGVFAGIGWKPEFNMEKLAW